MFFLWCVSSGLYWLMKIQNLILLSRCNCRNIAMNLPLTSVEDVWQSNSPDSTSWHWLLICVQLGRLKWRLCWQSEFTFVKIVKLRMSNLEKHPAHPQTAWYLHITSCEIKFALILKNTPLQNRKGSLLYTEFAYQN